MSSAKGYMGVFGNYNSERPALNPDHERYSYS